MFGDVFLTRVEMSPEIRRILREMWTAITFVCFTRTTGDLSMDSADVFVKVSSVSKVPITSLLETIKTRLLLDSGVDLTWLQHEEAKVSSDHAVMEPLMFIPRLEKLEGLGTLWTWKVTTSVYLPVPDEVLLGVKHLPAGVTGVSTHLMDTLLVLTEALRPICLIVTFIT